MMNEQLATVAPDQTLSQWDRFLRDPSVDVEKLKALFELFERDQARQARQAFNAAFSAMQGELPTIDESGRAVVPSQRTGTTHSWTYARQEDIIDIVRPILAKYGFSLRHRHLYPEGKVKIIGILSHRDGHSEDDEFEARADTSGSKNEIQAVGSTRTYGERYTTRSLLGIVSRDPKDPARDTDGQRHVALAPETPNGVATAPNGFDAHWKQLEEAATTGFPSLAKQFNGSPDAFRKHVMTSRATEWMALKARAAQVVT